jgi:HlyD family secretion protein
MEKRRPRYALFVWLLLLAAALGGGGWWGFKLLKGSGPKPVRSERVDRGDVEIKVTETGTIEPLKKVELKSKVAGRVSRLYVDEGASVKAGQLLAEIDPTEINSQVEQIRAQLDGARARYEQAKRAVLYQKRQTETAILQNQEAVRGAQSRLTVAEQESRTQPELSESEVAQAAAGLKAAQESLDLLKRVTHPQALVQAQSTFADVKAGEQTARRRLARQRELLSQGFAPRQEVEDAEADLATARARLDQARAKLSSQEEQNRLEIASAESRLAEARAALARAQANRSLTAIKAEAVHSAQASAAEARAQLAGARAGKQQDKMRQDEAVAARASVAQLEQQLREVQVHQFDTRLIASMDGVVTKRYIEQGELVTSGVSTFSSGTPVFQIADLAQMRVRMTVNEVDVHKVRPGLPVEVAIDGVKGAVFGGQVTQVAPASLTAGAGGEGGGQGQQGGGGGGGGGGAVVIRFAVLVTVARPDARLKPGMSARCTIVIARRKGVLRLPNSCVEGDGAGASVQIVTEPPAGSKQPAVYTSRKVAAGLRGDAYVEILSGLKEGEKVKPGAFSGPKRRGLDIGP